MATTPQEEEPGFETDVSELPDDDQGSEDTLEDEPGSEDEESEGMEEAQEEAAEERKEGGYQ